MPTPKQPKPKPVTYKPPDWLGGSTTVGKPYKAWDDYNQGTPDFGAGNGPGTPYHEVQKVVSKPPKSAVPAPALRWASSGSNASTGPSSDPRINIIRRRLGWF